jgi:hypothetical protein
MANAIIGGNDLFSAYIHGAESVKNRNFLSRQWDNVSNAVQTRGRAFIERTRKAFEEYDTDILDRGVRAIKRRMDNRWGDNEVCRYSSIGEFQNANVKMIRWMQANPRIRKATKGGRCNGWEGLYVDLEPELWGENHSDYQRVMNGMNRTDEHGHTHFTTYMNACDEDNEELTFGSQIDILHSWEQLETYMDANLDDPTDKNNNAL